jgi:MFS family permease
MDIYRHVLKLYPRSVRADYGDAMRQVHRDLRVHGGLRGPRLVFATTRDVVRSAPRLRLEEGMSHHPGRTRGGLILLISIVCIGLAALGPLVALPALIGLLLYMRRHRDDVREAGSSATLWVGLPMIGAILLVAGAIAGAIAGEDSAWWPLVVGPLLIGSTMIVVSLVLIAVHEVRVRALHRPELVEARPRAIGAGIGLGTLAVLLIAMGESRGWAMFMVVVISLITLGVLAVYAVMLHFTRPRGAAAT